MNEKPIAQALVICDQIITELQTNKKSIIGTFNSIASLKFPMQHAKLSIYAAMTNGRGQMVVDLRCVRMDDNKEIVKASGPMVFADPNSVVELIITLNQMPFERPGRYTFELHCDGEILMEKRFIVIQQSSQQFPPST